MFDFKKVALSAVIAVAAMTGAANAAIIEGVFNVTAVTYDANSNANAAATKDIFDTRASEATSSINTFTLTGPLDWFSNTTGTMRSLVTKGGTGATVGGILNVQNASVGSSARDVTIDSTNYTQSGFNNTTIFKITGTQNTLADVTISHDDGIQLYNADSVLVLDYPTPTSLATTPLLNFLKMGTFNLYYSAANDVPEVLTFNGTVIPLPAPILLLLGGMAGLGFVSRKRKAA